MSSSEKVSISFIASRNCESVGRRSGFMWKHRLRSAYAGRVIFNALRR
jgi:hypothetical protein